LAVLFGPLALVGLAAYLAVALAGAARIAVTLRRPTELPLAFWLIVVMHACYGAGVFRGLTTRRRAVAAARAQRRHGLDVPTVMGRRRGGGVRRWRGPAWAPAVDVSPTPDDDMYG